MSWERKLVPSSGTYLCSMQGILCRIRTLKGMYPLGKGIIKLQKIYGRLYLDRIETSLGYMDYNSKVGIRCKAQ